MTRFFRQLKRALVRDEDNRVARAAHDRAAMVAVGKMPLQAFT